MTARPSTGPHIITANRLYACAIFAGGMAVPHAAIGIIGHWPGQLMSMHVLLIELLLFAARGAEARTPGTPRTTDADSEFDDMVRMFRERER